MFFSVGVELPKDENTAYGLVIPALCTEDYGCFSTPKTPVSEIRAQALSSPQ
ncbi:hypothetical protein MEG1DRAFT_02939 [Photorhabdus temperata subsp. temperata Meg1]|uniref:Uncharacterized protein n=1 Tax=Photorhabdus temperata subsp. temperata Meg1 TaxID=1393735 RepID=A0A081RUY1_PHOTE|nr:hypothetical protein MEG1DRAFT_02939 [Photorhabdus temperata subsp. temperata Meg1]